MKRRYSLSLFLWTVAAAVSTASANLENAQDYRGPRDRFWRHHVAHETLMYQGKEYYSTLKECIFSQLTAEEINSIENDSAAGQRQMGLQLREDHPEPGQQGHVILMVMEKAIIPSHVKAIQTLASCVREHLPGFYEARYFAEELGLDKTQIDKGGNNPTHLAPLVGVFFPNIIQDQQATLQMAYEKAGWDNPDLRFAAWDASWKPLPSPSEVGYRASEHLTYRDFKQGLDPHTDGRDTAFTFNYAFSGPEDYEGGDFFIMYGEKGQKKAYFKPNKYDALIFLGGPYMHSVTEITSGHREMWSSEFWPFPDTPFGANLWFGSGERMNAYIEKCNEELGGPSAEKCSVEFRDLEEGGAPLNCMESGLQKANQAKEAQTILNNMDVNGLTPIGFYHASAQKEYTMMDFEPFHEQPYLLVPQDIDENELIPLWWRHSLLPVKGAFLVGLPDELVDELEEYMDHSHVLSMARMLVYDEDPIESDEIVQYTWSHDQTKWDARYRGSNRRESDAMSLLPRDSPTWDKLFSVLNKGKFQLTLNRVSQAFQIPQSTPLVVRGMSLVFYSRSMDCTSMHLDGEGYYEDNDSETESFIRILIPLHLPEDDAADFKDEMGIGEPDATAVEEDGVRWADVRMEHDLAIALAKDTHFGPADGEGSEENREVVMYLTVLVAPQSGVSHPESKATAVADDSSALAPNQTVASAADIPLASASAEGAAATVVESETSASASL